MKAKRLGPFHFGLMVFIAALAAGAIAGHGAELYTLDEAIDHGVVDMASWSPPGETAELIGHLGSIAPGIVNRFGFFWSGPTQGQLDHAGAVAADIRRILPKALFGAAWPEAVRPDYHVSLRCGGEMGERAFTVSDLTIGRVLQHDAIWLDISKPETQDYYKCLGQIYLEKGFSLLHFEEAGHLVRDASSPEAAIEAYHRVFVHLSAYAKSQSLPIYFSGAHMLASAVDLSAAYIPARFYTVTVPEDVKYQNKITRPGHGIGYSYTLSSRIVADSKQEFGPAVKLLFYVDNWDPTQDDLRRFMELDPDNRRFLISASLAAARSHGVTFVPPLSTCVGCVPVSAVSDTCEILPAGQTEYNPLRCGDLALITRTSPREQ
jgi:hypothetical protein